MLPVLESGWVDVEAVNTLDEFIIEYPTSETAQLNIADKLQNVSKSNLANAQVPLMVYQSILSSGECFILLFISNVKVSSKGVFLPD
jgi:hypothetical protein